MQLTGKVIKGDGYGRELGFPTANIDPREHAEFLKDVELGIYAGFVTIQKTNETYRAGIVIGPRVESGLPKVEAHLIDFTGDLYGDMVTFHVRDFIRGFQEYSSESELRQAIENDIAHIKQLEVCLPES